jgi:hypothetical protein
VAYAKDRWPDYEEEIEAAANTPGQEDDAMIGIGSGVPWPGSNASGTRDSGPNLTGEGRLAAALTREDDDEFDVTIRDGQQKPARVMLLEMFFKDTEEVPDEEEIEVPYDQLLATGAIVEQKQEMASIHVLGSTGEPVTDENRPRIVRKFMRPKFPNGRSVLRIGRTILNPNEDDQRWPYAHWPYVIGVNYTLPHTWRGLNDVEIPKPMQDWVNETSADLGAYIEFHALPITKVEEGAVQNCPNNQNVADKLRVGPASFWKVSPGKAGAVVREGPPPMSETVFSIYETMSRELRDQTGVQEIAMGRQASGGITATEALRLETNTRLRMSLQARHEDAFILDIMLRTHELAVANMTPGQLVRIAGEDVASRMMAIPEEAFDVEFDMELKTTTGLPFDEERKKQEAMQLFQIIGPPYLEELLKAFQVENREKVLSSVQAWAMIQQAMAAQEQVAKAGLGAPPGPPSLPAPESPQVPTGATA